MASNCGMCQRSVTSYDYIPAESVGEVCLCNLKNEYVPVDGTVCSKYIPSRKEKRNNEN